MVTVMIHTGVADSTVNSPYRINNKSRDEENNGKHDEEEVTQTLIFGVLGQFSCLLKKTKYNSYYITLTRTPEHWV